jgi:hypothetical protein
VVQRRGEIRLRGSGSTTSQKLGFKGEKAMTHEDAGHYAGKRRGAQLNEILAARIKEKISENRISCVEAHNIVAGLNADPADVGIAIDLLEVRIIKCQLGLFGYGNKKNIPALPDKMNPDIESAIKSSLVNDRLACSAAWEIAKKFHLPKAMVAAACEAMKIKISPCQLGAFR